MATQSNHSDAQAASNHVDNLSPLAELIAQVGYDCDGKFLSLTNQQCINGLKALLLTKIQKMSDINFTRTDQLTGEEEPILYVKDLEKMVEEL